MSQKTCFEQYSGRSEVNKKATLLKRLHKLKKATLLKRGIECVKLNGQFRQYSRNKGRIAGQYVVGIIRFGKNKSELTQYSRYSETYENIGKIINL